jgi:C-terminal processing protease CtpA/Prc
VRAMERFVSGATPQFRRYRALQELRNGPEGSKVRLELQPAKGDAYAATLTRQPADDSPLRGPSLRETRLGPVTELEPGYLYVDLDRLKAGEFARMLPRLQKAKGVVFDARGYPLVWGEVLPHVTDKPLASDIWGIVVTRLPDRRGVAVEESEWKMPPREPRLTAKAAFVTDGRAVSAAETSLSLIATHKVAPVVGGATAGSNGGINVYVLPGGYRVSWTGMLATKRDRTAHHGVGVLPTHRVSRTVRAVAEGRDELVERALELVK